MKAKYYMRGIGLGMMIIAGGMLVAGIPSKQAELSKEEILEAAKQYGLEVLDGTKTDDDSELNLQGIVGIAGKDTEEGQDKTDAMGDDVGTSQEESSNLEDQFGTSEEELESGNQQSESEAEDTIDNSETAEKTEDSKEDKETQTKEDEQAEKNEQTSSVREYAIVEVKNGMLGAEFARAAYNAGLISDVEDFKQYMAEKRYANKMHVGTYQIEVGSTYQEICEIITTRR